MRSVHARFILTLSLSGLLAIGCSSSDPPAEGGGSGGTTAKTGGVSGSGGTPGGNGGTPSGTGGSPSGSGGTTSGTGGTPSGTGGTSTDAAGTGGTPGDASTGNDTGTPAGGNVTCGTAPAGFDNGQFAGAEGLVIGPDGTVYFASFGRTIGRYRPPYDKPAEKTWATMPAANAQVLGITLDPKAKVLYAGARQANKLYKVTLDDMPTVTAIADLDAGVNGLTLDEDGSVVLSIQNTGHIFRVTPDGTKTMITKTPVGNANGVAFGPDRKLYIVTYTNPGVVWQIPIANGVEADGRKEFARLARGNADGIAFDKSGNLYVTSGALWKVTPAGMSTMVNAQGGANVEFGVGALACTELLWGRGRVMNDTPGMDVPWHRAP